MSESNFPITHANEGGNSENLPDLVQRAADTLLSAKTSAEVLDARDQANTAFHAAKQAGRLAKAKGAHDDVIAKVYRAQADALLVESQAKARLADEYDAAQERGEVAVGNRAVDFGVVKDNAKPATANDLGIRRDEIHEARKIRDAEKADPGVVKKTLDKEIEEGRAPTKAAIRKAVLPEKPKAEKPTGEDKLRAEYRKLSDPEQDWLDLRIEVDEARKRIAAQRSQIADLKAQIKSLTDSDRGRTIGNLHKQVQALKHSLGEQQAANKRLEYRLKKIEGEEIQL